MGGTEIFEKCLRKELNKYEQSTNKNDWGQQYHIDTYCK